MTKSEYQRNGAECNHEPLQVQAASSETLFILAQSNYLVVNDIFSKLNYFYYLLNNPEQPKLFVYHIFVLETSSSNGMEWKHFPPISGHICISGKLRL